MKNTKIQHSEKLQTPNLNSRGATTIVSSHVLSSENNAALGIWILELL